MNKDDILLNELLHQDFSMENILGRIEDGNIGSFQIWDDYNKPFFIKDDIIHLKKENEYKKKDIVLYKFQDKYYLKRIIKIVSKKERVTVEATNDEEEESYTIEHKKYFLAADNERILHETNEEQIIAKAIARQRKNKYYSLSVKHHRPIYVFFKTHFLFLRFKGKAADYDMQINFETIRNATLALKKANKKERRSKNRDIKKDLVNFEDPNEFIIRYHKEHQNNEKENSEAI